MKKPFITAAFCFAPILAFSFCAGASPVAEKGGAKTGSTASEVKAPDGMGYTEFDYFNNVSDPLYREGTKALLKKAICEDRAPKAVVKKIRVPASARQSGPPNGRRAFGGKPALMRDAPADIPAAVKPAFVFPVKKNRLIKLIPADPVKTKSTL